MEEKKGSIFYIAVPWGTKERYGELVYWRQSERTREQEEVIRSLKRAFEDAYEVCKMGEISMSCGNCFNMSKKLIDLELARDGDLTWTELREEDIPTLKQLKRVPRYLKTHYEEMNDFTKMVFTKGFTSGFRCKRKRGRQ